MAISNPDQIKTVHWILCKHCFGVHKIKNEDLKKHKNIEACLTDEERQNVC
jgi:hypothetical protein